MPTRRKIGRNVPINPHHTPQAYAPGPGLREAREAAGVTIGELSEMTGYSPELLSKIESGNVPVPRLTTSRISAVLATEHTKVRGEEKGQVTRIRDVLIPGEAKRS